MVSERLTQMERSNMNTPPDVDISYRPLYNLAMGPLKAALLNCAIHLDLFDQLTEYRSGEEVARQLESHPANTRRLLDALATMDLLQKKDGRYRNQPIAKAFLVTGSPTYIGPLLKQIQHAGLNPLDQLEQLLRHGPHPDADMDNLAVESIWAEEAKAAAGWVVGGTGQQVAQIVSCLPGFPSFVRMLDLGCGHGMFSYYILSRHPELKSVLFDRSAVLDAARPLMERCGISQRLVYMAGDYLHDAIGSGYDLIYASATLNFAIGCLDMLLAKLFDALNPGGYLVCLQDGMTCEQTKPDTMLGAVIPAMMMGYDYCFSQGLIAETAIRQGFCSVRSKTISTPIGEMDLDIARKAE
jgi:SAM-dependent methyltransferase